MTATLAPSPSTRSGVKQYTTFYVEDLLLGIDIAVVQEINRQSEITPVPNAPPHVRGVINLRGDVATVIDLRCVLGLPPAGDSRDTRNLIVHSQGEAIGLCVDRISDILTVTEDQVSRPPANVSGVDGRFMLGVHTLEREIVILLDVEKVLSDRD
ncbi:MAG: chemotaxis protein CheW [Lacipirellulaceae bacterium]